MIDRILFAATLLALLGSGLIGGVFFAFSAFVMKALARRPPAEGIAAMQSVNTVILRSWFMTVFLVTAGLCVLALVHPLWHWQGPADRWRIAGAALYLAGGMLVTIACNVPRNEALETLAPGDPASAPLWAEYVSRWTRWNHVRMLACAAASVAFGIALAT